MLHKSCPAHIKAVGTDGGLEEGQFRAVVSVFGNKDSYGDIVVKGAFADTLKAWAAKGDPIPVYWSHRMDDPDYNIGQVIEAKETDVGLEVLAQIDLDDDAPSKARQTYRLLKGRRVTQFSFAYDIDEAGWVESDDDSWYELRRLTLHEVGPTPIGANQETELLAVKAASEHAAKFAEAVKAGRVLSSKNENTLREAVASLDAASKSITDVLAAVSDEESNDEKAKASEPAKDEGHEVKSEEPMHPSPSDLSALLSIQLADAS
jgi:HK97 family phage prohead protease